MFNFEITILKKNHYDTVYENNEADLKLRNFKSFNMSDFHVFLNVKCI